MDLLTEATLKEAELQLEHYAKIEGRLARAIIAHIKAVDKDNQALLTQIEVLMNAARPNRLAE